MSTQAGQKGHAFPRLGLLESLTSVTHSVATRMASGKANISLDEVNDTATANFSITSI